MGGLIDMRSSTVIAAGQIAVMVVGFALGVVVTLIVVIDQWGTPQTVAANAPGAIVYPRRPPPPTVSLSPSPAASLPQAMIVPPPASGEPTVSPPPPAAPLPPPQAADAPGGRYVVQAGAFLSQAAANAMARSLDAKGHPTVVQTQAVGGGRMLNVVRLTQTFETRAAAQAAARELSHGEGVSTLVARLPAGDASPAP